MASNVHSDGKTVMGTIGTVNRQDLTYAQIPKPLQDSVLAAEDRSFWTEGGISPTGIVRAAYDDVTSSGGNLSGGSTITQEFVRGYYDGIGAQQTVSRKVKEIFIAQKLTKTKSKQWILANYMNLIYLGDNSYGVSAAAETYFGKPVSKLTIAQDAVIAAIIQQPSNYPRKPYRTDLVARWHYVLNGMVTLGDLTQAQANAEKFPALLTDSSSAATKGASVKAANGDVWAPYLMQQVENELTAYDGVSEQQLETGGLRIVTTVSRAKEVALYKSVNDTLSAAAISTTYQSTLSSLPSWALVGAELETPKSGEIVAEYPGKTQDLSAKKCAEADCDVNTAVYAREQVGSSFKPYVLSTAVSQGMNVKTSIMDTSPYLCVLPDTQAMAYSVPISAGTYELPGTESGCPDSSAYKVENDGGEQIGRQVGTSSTGAATFADNPQGALALSSNTGFTDLAHRVGLANVVQMAANFGVNVKAYSSGGSGLDTPTFGTAVGIALGIAPMTVNEQSQMLATIADNGLYHQAHVIKYWQQGVGGAQIQPKFDSHVVLTPAEAAQVQYAMEQTTISGTAVPNVTYGTQALGTVISKTGTTTDSHSGFFIGSTTQATLVVGMFTSSGDTNSKDNLAELGGGGFGGYWPAKIWNSFAESNFSSSPGLFPTSPAFTGQKWNLVGKVTKPKPTVTCTVDGKKKKIPGTSCPAPAATPSPTPTCTGFGQTNCVTPSQSATPTPTCSYDGESIFDGCTTASSGTSPSPSPTCSFQGQTDCSSTGTGGATPSPTPTCSFNGEQGCTSTTSGGAFPQAKPTATASSAKSGFAVAGTGLLLPGSLVWARARRRRRRAGTPE